MKKLFTGFFILVLIFSVNKTFAQFANADFTVNYGYLYGSSATYTDADDDFGGWVSDGAGNAYVIHANKTIDYTESNIIISKVQLSDGTILWSKKYGSDSRGEKLVEPGGNGITVGGASSRNIAIDADGNVYFICNIYDGYYRPYVAKISPTDGSIVWEKSWKNADNDLASSEAIVYSLDVQAGKVFMAGTTSNTDLLLVYDASDGSLLSVSRLDLYTGSGDKAYAVRASADGNTVYIAGWTAKNYQDGMLAKLSSSGTVLEWYDYIDFPSASRINDIDLDASGNIYLCSDIHGTDTYLEVIKVDSDGNLVWEKNFGQGNNNDRYNGTNVDVFGDHLYLTGRAGLNDDNTYVDSQFGDGMFLKYDLDGNLLKKYFYFTGTDNTVMAADWVKGVIEYNGNIYLSGSTYPYASNYTGSWFVAPDHSGVDAGIALTKETSPDAFVTDDLGFDAGLTMGTVADFNGAVHEDITNATGTTFGATQVYFWSLTPSASAINNVNNVEISLYPNPADDILYLTIGDNSEYAEISIVNTAGQTVVTKSFDNVDIKTIDLTDVASGVYMVNIKTENFTTTKKIIIK